MGDPPRTQWGLVAAVAVLLTAAMVVVAIAARAPLSGSTTVDASAAAAPLAALLLVLVGASGVALAAWLARALTAARRRRDVEPEYVPQNPPIHWLLKTLAVLSPFALGGALVTAALLGTRSTTTGPRFAGGAAAHAPPTATPHTHAVYSLPDWLPWIVLAVALVTVAVAWMLVARRRPRDASPPSDRDPARASLEMAIDELQRHDDPRGAVIAAYLAMERTLADRGLARASAEAPREYLHRVLVHAGVAEREATLLTGLFEQARFSTHTISERLRTQARIALTSLRDRLSTGGAA
jgi:hypothetical protein